MVTPTRQLKNCSGGYEKQTNACNTNEVCGRSRGRGGPGSPSFVTVVFRIALVKFLVPIKMANIFDSNIDMPFLLHNNNIKKKEYPIKFR
jgi:hypothetical protein